MLRAEAHPGRRLRGRLQQLPPVTCVMDLVTSAHLARSAGLQQPVLLAICSCLAAEGCWHTTADSKRLKAAVAHSQRRADCHAPCMIGLRIRGLWAFRDEGVAAHTDHSAESGQVGLT